ncbi:putative disease resistance protein [Forsythia ovata]|uniref:Disease resistance protein n=1 Tax=Forsythia ovata TaxID=205694 RepID=A0ABD1V172_9LAMI
MDNSIYDISPDTSPKCPRLSSLILSKNSLLKFIPECFFEQLRGLYVLNLSETSIEQLPNSISHLEKLNALLLGGCGNLVYVPPLEKLRLLRQLDLTGTSIEEVPKGRLRSYHIILNEPGEVFGYDEYYPPCKVVHLGYDSLADSSLGVDENLLPQDIEELLFEGSGLSCCLLDYFQMLNNAKDLKRCDIVVEDKIECIMRLSSEEEQHSRSKALKIYPFMVCQILLVFSSGKEEKQFHLFHMALFPA